MKFIKKIFAKLSGALKYLKYYGRLLQTLKTVSAIIPQLAALVADEKNKSKIDELSVSLTKIITAMDTTEKYLNDLGIETTTVTERDLSLEANVAAVKRIADAC